MKVRIIKSSEEVFWYAKREGEIFDVHEYPDRHGNYDLKDGQFELKLAISVTDCEIVKESAPTS